jgi:DNA-binding transcriptional LysR family regulator
MIGEVSQLIRRLLDELTVAVSAEHAAEEKRQARSGDDLDRERVVRLLKGELRFADHFAYDFHGRHLGVVAIGLEAPDAMGVLAKAVEARLLAIKPGELSAWAWLQVSGEVDWSALEGVAATLPGSVAVAVGEQRQGIAGWRRTHLEARAALALAARAPARLVRYGRNELLVAAMNDELLGDSLRDSYLGPLSAGGRGAVALKQTVRAYLETGRNASSAAATLGISRQTVNARVRTAEDLIGQPLVKCASAVEVALRLDSVTDGGAVDAGEPQ